MNVENQLQAQATAGAFQSRANQIAGNDAAQRFDPAVAERTAEIRESRDENANDRRRVGEADDVSRARAAADTRAFGDRLSDIDQAAQDLRDQFESQDLQRATSGGGGGDASGSGAQVDAAAPTGGNAPAVFAESNEADEEQALLNAEADDAAALLNQDQADAASLLAQSDRVASADAIAADSFNAEQSAPTAELAAAVNDPALLAENDGQAIASTGEPIGGDAGREIGAGEASAPLVEPEAFDTSLQALRDQIVEATGAVVGAGEPAANIPEDAVAAEEAANALAEQVEQEPLRAAYGQGGISPDLASRLLA